MQFPLITSSIYSRNSINSCIYRCIIQVEPEKNHETYFLKVERTEGQRKSALRDVGGVFRLRADLEVFKLNRGHRSRDFVFLIETLGRGKRKNVRLPSSFNASSTSAE